MTAKKPFSPWVILLVLFATGCHHHIAFEDINYDIGAKQYDESLVVVIDPTTLNKTVTIRSFMTGIAHSWDARPGEMLKQVADVEFPQMFKHYELAQRYVEPDSGQNSMILQLTIPQYAFADFHAYVTVRATAYGPGRSVLFEKDYQEEGFGQGSKMFWAGPFGMKSAVRQSSFDAYKKVFAALRKDMIGTLDKGSRVSP